ncbi:MAG: hypothetical protein JJU26_10395 [Oceanicaulis sp.]|uniref:hypothetical protein n=1 Tax=Glycocaulis sp. TaxID=1969725 RepID=UPI0025BDA76F|nr:hypothetical protein [Glycocaulis sp.]MCC5982113.1 hypothetical protein [Oceanicaulis sp.]MCH8522110.1 hypothetical protein [Glycocaulis sp.]
MLALILASLVAAQDTPMDEVDLNIYCNAQAGVIMQYDDPDFFAEDLMISTGEWIENAIESGATTRDHVYDRQAALFEDNQPLILAGDVAALEARFAPCREAFGG